ncbi:hypothetical protein INS49_006409 [Diaporthe citri]|uniref:uncharacterized protein n=1 Tax=Diaporthe citri TaxID=83186 RepID=UPI001C820AEC|nr:uncharacterized protein INS49_006409 [Diaporthe citri]KAG6364805.1 hypothetical protein INS49_006409 [Diaporthe citri]
MKQPSQPIETAPTPCKTHSERQEKAREATMDFKKRLRNMEKPKKDETAINDNGDGEQPDTSSGNDRSHGAEFSDADGWISDEAVQLVDTATVP